MPRRAALILLLIVVAAALLASRTIAPSFVAHYEYAPELARLPKRTTNARGYSGDPINVGMVGSLDELRTAMQMAGWVVADSLTRAAKIAIARSVLFNRPDSTAPVSPLILFDRQQDIAFEREVGRSARSRHHARFWLATGIAHDGRPVWLGDATFDQRVGISRRGLHPTHHIAPNVDQERDTLLADLMQAGQIALRFEVTGVGPQLNAYNAEGDRFDTDGEMEVGIIPVGNVRVAVARTLPPPPAISLKNRVWSWFTSTGRR